MAASTKLQVGDVAPDFTLLGTGDASYSLHDQRGSIVVLAFYPGDGTPVCTRQLVSYSKRPAVSEFSNVTTWAISPQNVESHEAFASANNLCMPLLHDEGKAVGKAYGILGPIGFYRRSVFVIDGDGIIRFAKCGTAGLSYPDPGVIQAAIDSIARPGEVHS